MRGRGPVVHLDRSKKAMMIEAILEDYHNAKIAGLTTLDIGCGNGGISRHFAQSNTHFGVDVTDLRKDDTSSFEFHLVEDETLPFPDDYFNIVLSNHVIEHVNDQPKHLREIHRVLKPGGCVYLATPNRSSPIMEGHVGNDRVLRYREMVPLITSCGFKPTEYSVAVASEPARFHGEVAWARNIPKSILRLLRPFFPSHIFILTA